MPVIVKSAAINSNGTGGGYYNNTASWAGGVVPTIGDTFTIVTGDTITVNTSFTIGTFVAANNAITINNNACLDVPYNIGIASMTVRGDIEVAAGGRWNIARDTQPYVATSTFTILMDCVSDGAFGINLAAGAGSSIQWFGNYQYNVSNSTTTHCSPLNAVTSSSNSIQIPLGYFTPNTNDQINIAGTEATNQAELLTVSTYTVHATSATITFTSNFSYTHSTMTYVEPTSRNIRVVSRDITKRANIAWTGSGTLSSNPDVNLEWVEFNNIGQNTGIASSVNLMYLEGISWVRCGRVLFSGGFGDYYNMIFANGYYAIPFYLTGTDHKIYNSLFAANQTYALQDSASYSYYENSVFANGVTCGLWPNACYSPYIKNCKFLANGNSGDMWLQYYVSDAIFDNCEQIQATRKAPYMFVQQALKFHTATVLDCNWGATPIYNNVDASEAAYIKVQNHNDIVNNNAYIVGGGSVTIEESVVRTAGNKALRFGLIGGTQNGIKLCESVPCNAGDTVILQAYLRKNSSYGSSTLPYISLESNDGSVNSIEYMSDTDNAYELVTIADTVTSTGTIKLCLGAESANSNAVAYFDEVKIFVGNNVSGCNEVWVNGIPSPANIATTVDASNLWKYIIKGKQAEDMLYEIRIRKP